jgi:hypothetical protein
MKITLTILITFFFIGAFGQNASCKLDTFNLTLAYEIGGQFSLDDQIIKSPGFVKFNDNVSLQDYKNGYFELPNQWESGSAFRKFKGCNLKVNFDSLLKYTSASLDSLKTKTWTTTNKTYAGKGETMLGTKVDMPPLEFKYKVFQIKFVAVSIGDNPKTLINIDRKNKKEKQLLEIKCNEYIITKIIDIKTLE